MSEKIIFRDVTNKITFGFNDEENLPIIKCICGQTFGHWAFVIGIYKDDPVKCPYCGRKFFFRASIRVYEVK